MTFLAGAPCFLPPPLHSFGLTPKLLPSYFLVICSSVVYLWLPVFHFINFLLLHNYYKLVSLKLSFIIS